LLNPDRRRSGKTLIRILEFRVAPFSGWIEKSQSYIDPNDPPRSGIQDFYHIAMPLNQYGIPDLCPVLLFRISGEGDIEPAV